MKRKFTFLAALALLVFMAPSMVMWGQTRAEVVAYTLDGTQTGGSNGYATESEITQNDITWMVTANTDINPWRFGGKSLSGVDRPMYSTSQIEDNITKFVVTNGTTNLTVNSMTLIVSDNADFSNPTSTVAGTWAASSTTTFERPAGADWTNKYYKLVYNLTTTSTSNKYAQFVKAELYKEEGSGPVIATPTFSPAAGTYTEAQSVTISCETQGSTIYYTTDGSTPSSTSAQYTAAISVSTTTTIKAIAYVGDDASSVAMATYTIAEHLTTMDEIFAAATAAGTTATPAVVTFNNWVVTGVKNSNAYVTDGTKGFIVYTSGHGFTVGDVLSGTASCNVQLYKGAAEITGLTSTTSGLTVTAGGTVTPVTNISIADLSGVNTGAVFSYENLTYNGTNLVDGNGNAIKPFNSLFTYTFVTDHVYNVTGVFVQYDSDKEILPRSADDIEEVGGTVTIATPTFSPAAGTYTEAQSVTISCETPNVTIYYTTNGNDPDDESTLYEGPITVGESMTIKAIAYDENDNTSAIGTAEYVINLPVPSAPYARVDNASYLTNGAKVVFAARFDGNTDQYYAMTNAASGKPTGVLFTSTTSDGYEVLPDAIVDEESSYYWTVGVTENGYTFTNANGQVIGWTSSTSFAIGGDNTVWTVERGTSGDEAMVPGYEAFNIVNFNTINASTVRAFALNNSHNFGPYALSNNNNADYNFSIDIFVEGATPVATPSITANNVTITYDTDGDEIEYLINNPVDGGSLVASTDSDWLEVGDEAYTSNAGTIEFTCSVNPTAAARTATVTLTYTYNRATVTKNVTVTQEANPNAIDNISDITEAGTYTVRGTVVATSTRGFVLGDGTGYIYYYKGSAVEQSVGDIVTISGEVSASTNYKVFQYTSGATITAAETSNYQAEDPTALTGAQMDAIVTGSTVILSNYVQYQGVLSISNNHYNITDIDGAVTAIGSISYPTSTDFTSLDGKTVLVKGYYVGVSSNTYYNTMLGTIEEVEVPHEEYTVTVSNLVNVNTYLFNGDEMVLEGEGTVNILDGNEVLISLDVAEGYVIESLMVDGNNVTSQIAEDHSYTFNMPTHNVTITATAVEIPVFTPATYTLASTVESGKQYIIVAQRVTDEAVEYYAMGEQRNSNRKGVLVNANDNTITVNSEEVYEFTISSLEGENFYSIYDARTPGYLYAAASGGNQLKTEAALDENHNGDWEITIDAETNVASVSATNSNNRHVMQFNYNGGNPAIFSCYADATQTAVYLYVKDETPAGTPLFISGYNGSAFANGGYHLIATPVDGIDPANVTNMTNGNFDLYMFDQSGDDEWVNYRQGNNQFAFTELVAGMGYLYAHDTDITLYFEGDLIEGDSYDVSLVLDTDSEFPGWNLVGNSFTVPASIGDRDYYEMHENGRDLIQTSGAIDPMQGIFVIAETDEEELTFSKTITTGGSKVVMNVTSDRSSLVDRATIRFGEGRQLRKIQLNPDNTKIYITEGDTDYAVVRSSDEAEIPVSFKTAENGTYTINFSTEEVEMEYMHLIDNMTGADVDLLATPSYTFEARTTDYASRFRLVFATTTGVSENSENNFAFYNGGNWVINNMGDATLQVVDMLGHILSSETINGNASISIDQVPGVYMIRLVSGNDVKVQKVIIK